MQENKDMRKKLHGCPSKTLENEDHTRDITMSPRSHILVTTWIEMVEAESPFHTSTNTSFQFGSI